jgi:hypothetical protein
MLRLHSSLEDIEREHILEVEVDPQACLQELLVQTVRHCARHLCVPVAVWYDLITSCAHPTPPGISVNAEPGHPTTPSTSTSTGVGVGVEAASTLLRGGAAARVVLDSATAFGIAEAFLRCGRRTGSSVLEQLSK